MNAPFRFLDSLLNLVSGLGTSKDKNIFNQFALTTLDAAQLSHAYRGDWIARKIVNIPANDATREWRAWQASSEQIEKLEAEEARLAVQQKTMRAMICGRLYGGGVLVMGMADKTPDRELRPDSVRLGDLRYLQWLSRYEISAGERVTDVESPYFGEPEYYDLTVPGTSPVRVHPSRVVRFVGNEIIDRAVSDGWGDSVLQAVDDAVKAAGITNAGIASIVNEAKMDVVKIPNLMDQLSTTEYKDRLVERFQLANIAKSHINTLLLDKEEEWNRQSSSFAGLPDVLKLYMLIACGAADIPATRFLGQSAQGLNATGEGDLRNYYDHVASDQKNELRPALARLDEVIVRSALGARDPRVHYEWRPLWQLSEAERSEIAVKKATVVQVDAQLGLIDLDALAEVRVNQLVEDGFYPGLEEAVAESGEESELPEDDQEVEEQEKLRREQVGDSLLRRRRARRRQLAKDAAPRTLYVRRDLLNGADLIAWAKSQGFPDTVPQSAMHVTVAFSRQPVDWMRVGADHAHHSEDGTLTVQAGGPRLVERLGDAKDAVVLMFACSRLSWRHCEIKDAGASWDWPEYQPHVTVSYSPEAGGLDLRGVEPYRGELRFGPEIFEEVDEDWKRKLLAQSDAYDPDQPRDPGGEGGGQWISGGGGGASESDVRWFKSLKQGEILKLKGADLTRAWSAAPDSMARKFLAQWTAEDVTSPLSRRMAAAALPLTVSGGVLEKFHPGEVTVYRGATSTDKTRGMAWSADKKTASGYGSVLYMKKVTPSTPALDLDKMGGGGYREIITSPEGSSVVKK